MTLFKFAQMVLYPNLNEAIEAVVPYPNAPILLKCF